MDKYDVMFIRQVVLQKIKIKDLYKNRKSIYVRYLKWKLDKMWMEHHTLKNKKLNKKFGWDKKNRRPLGIHKALELKRGATYAWDMLCPMPKIKQEK